MVLVKHVEKGTGGVGVEGEEYEPVGTDEGGYSIFVFPDEVGEQLLRFPHWIRPDLPLTGDAAEALAVIQKKESAVRAEKQKQIENLRTQRAEDIRRRQRKKETNRDEDEFLAQYDREKAAAEKEAREAEAEPEAKKKGRGKKNEE